MVDLRGGNWQVGAPYETAGGQARAGAAYEPGGHFPRMHQGRSELPGRAVRNDRLGSAIAKSDRWLVTVIGVPRKDVDGRTNAGEILVEIGLQGLAGGELWLQLDQASAGVPGGVEAGDRFGAVLAAW